MLGAMYLILIAWFYVTLMMAIAEATNPVGSVLGGIVTFVLYGLLPMAIVGYIMATPERKRRLKARREAEQQAWDAAQEPPATTTKPTPTGTIEEPATTGIDSAPVVPAEVRPANATAPAEQRPCKTDADQRHATCSAHATVRPGHPGKLQAIENCAYPPAQGRRSIAAITPQRGATVSGVAQPAGHDGRQLRAAGACPSSQMHAAILPVLPSTAASRR